MPLQTITKDNQIKMIPPTVAPIRATNSSKGMLKKELSASHVSARALKGAANIKTFAARNAVTGTPNLKLPCPISSFNQLEQFDQNGTKKKKKKILLIFTHHKSPKIQSKSKQLKAYASFMNFKH